MFDGTERFEVVAPLGSGGMGTVFKVRDRQTDSFAALKLLEAPSADALRRFKREFRVLQGIQHPNLITLGELEEAAGTWFYTMELVEGAHFLDYVRDERGAVVHARLRDAMTQLARALSALHRSRKVHCDIKPDNVVVTSAGRLVVLDFGLSLDVGHADFLAREEGIVGTGAYMAPEQIDGGVVGAPADCYALGAMLFEALTGRLPFEGTLIEVLAHKRQAPAPRPSDVANGVPDDLETLCIELLRREPDRRPTADDVLARLGTPRAAPKRVAIADSGELFVGRDIELRKLLAATQASATRTVVVSGASGVGKTALVHRFVERVRDVHEHVMVLEGRCYERESVPFKGIDGVIDSLAIELAAMPGDATTLLVPEHAGLLVQVFPVLGRLEAFREVERGDHSNVSAHERRRRVFTAVRELWAALCHRRRVVVVIDDVQWASEDTWALLEHVVQPPDSPPVVLVMTMRVDEELALPPADRLPGAVDVIELAALPMSEARALAARLLAEAGRADAVDPASLAREAEGQPFFIRQLVQHVVDAGQAGASEARLHDALGVRFDRLSKGALELLRLVAIAGVPIPHATMATATDTGFSEYQRLVRELEGAHMVRSRGARGADSIEHYHDRIREAVSAELSQDRRKILHTRLANAIESSGYAERAPQVAVQHLAAAGHSVRAAYHAETAALRAFEALAFEQAASLFRTALELGTHEAARERSLKLALCEALVNAGRGAEAADLYLECAATGTVAERLDLQRAAAEQLLLSGHIARGVEVLETVLADVGEALPATPRRALASLIWQRTLLRLRGLRWRRRDESEIAPRALIECDVYRTVGSGLAIVDNVRGADYQCRFLRRALALGEPERVAHALSFEAGLQAAQGSRRSWVIARRLERDATESGDPGAMAWARLAGAGIAIYLDNDWHATLRSADEAEHLLRRYFHRAGWETDTARLFRCFGLLHLGEIDHLRRLVRIYVRDAARRGDRYLSVNVRARLVMPWLADDDPAGGRADVEEALSQWIPWRKQFLVQHFFALHSLCELALYEGDADAAAEHMAAQLEAMRGSLLLRLHMPRGEVDHLRGRIALARGQLDDAKGFARALSRNPLPAPKAWAMLLRAGVAKREGDVDGAKRKLRAAIDVLDRTNNRMYAMAARVALQETTVDEARKWATDNSIVALDKLAALLVPGFD